MLKPLNHDDCDSRQALTPRPCEGRKSANIQVSFERDLGNPIISMGAHFSDYSPMIGRGAAKRGSSRGLWSSPSQKGGRVSVGTQRNCYLVRLSNAQVPRARR